jgi:hypothetical protein
MKDNLAAAIFTEKGFFMTGRESWFTMDSGEEEKNMKDESKPIMMV